VLIVKADRLDMLATLHQHLHSTNCQPTDNQNFDTNHLTITSYYLHSFKTDKCSISYRPKSA